jgi:hypothetical protein
MGNSIAAAAAVFAVALAAVQHTALIGNFGEPVVLVAMGTLFIILSKLLTPATGADGTGLGATVINLPSAVAA